MPKQNRRAASQKAASTTKRRVSAPLTVTLNAEVSKLVRELASAFHTDLEDTANGVLMEELPDLLRNWRDDSKSIARGEHATSVDQYDRTQTQIHRAREIREVEYCRDNERERARLGAPEMVTFARPLALTLPARQSFALRQLAQHVDGVMPEDIAISSLESSIQADEDDGLVLLATVQQAKKFARSKM